MLHKPDKKNEVAQNPTDVSIIEQAQKENQKHEHHGPKEITLKIDEYNKLKQEAQNIQEYKDKFLRLQADFDNARKRLEKDRIEFIKYANEGLIVELLGLLDDLERSVEAAETKHEDPLAFLKGIEMILAHLYEMLKKKGIKPIDAKGKIFDPNLHEALMQIETNDFLENTVVEELQKGYMLEDRVIRTAKVKVAKKKEEHAKDTK